MTVQEMETVMTETADRIDREFRLEVAEEMEDHLGREEVQEDWVEMKEVEREETEMKTGNLGRTVAQAPCAPACPRSLVVPETNQATK